MKLVTLESRAPHGWAVYVGTATVPVLDWLTNAMLSIERAVRPR